MNDYEISDRFGKMLASARESSINPSTGKPFTQSEVALAVGVSRKTIQNWEYGFGKPDQKTTFKIFKSIGVQPNPYYISLICGDDFDLISDKKSNSELNNTLYKLIELMTPHQKRELIYCVCGPHGSSPSAILEMVTAHLHTPLHDRINIASSILTSYEMCSANLTDSKYELPNTDLLKTAFTEGKNAAMLGFDEYSIADI